jgi:1,4-dihydroxy-2-naphthoate octaprenyltransferase
MFGIKFARVEYMFLVIGTYIAQILLILAGMMPLATLVTLVTLPEALKLINIYNTSRDVPLMHQAQGRTAKLHGQIGLLIVIGWVLSLP